MITERILTWKKNENGTKKEPRRKKTKTTKHLGSFNAFKENLTVGNQKNKTYILINVFFTLRGQRVIFLSLKVFRTKTALLDFSVFLLMVLFLSLFQLSIHTKLCTHPVHSLAS